MLRKRAADHNTDDAPHLLRKMLIGIHAFLDQNLLGDHIVYIEQRQNGSQYLESIPRRVGPLLQDRLYRQYATTLLLPPMPAESFQEILPAGTDVLPHEESVRGQFPIAAPEALPLEDLLLDPPKGKTIILVGSRKAIEDAFIRHTERLEEQGVTLICQNLSGGQERMQAEFLAADAPVLWLLTPWTYETVELPVESADHLIIMTLPFDHPDHPILSKRSECYRDPFGQYALPRLKARLFRVLRTFSRHARSAADVCIYDDRLTTKRYGKEVRDFILGLGADDRNTLGKRTSPDVSPQQSMFNL